jgi:deoxyribonuclease V
MGLKHHTPLPTSFESEEEAHEIQTTLAASIKQETGWANVTGTSVVYGERSGVAYAVAVTLSTSNWRAVEVQRWSGEPPLKYQEGLLSFRDAPPMLRALLKLNHTPDVVFVDGHGQSHIRKFGPACAVGLALQHPTIGIGRYHPNQLGAARANFGHSKRGNKIAVMLGSLKVGYEIITQDREKPVFVSVGNQVGLDEAVTLTYKATPVYRLPEPIRQAEIEALKFRESVEGR